MFDEDPDRGAPTSLRGWLSDIYFAVLLDPSERTMEGFVGRLGGRATVDDPIFGRCGGLPSLERYVQEQHTWLKARGAAYLKTRFTMGADRDVTEGVLTLQVGDRHVELPIAVVAERRKSREVELRLYYSTQPIQGTHAVRSPLVAEDKDLVLPAGVEGHLDALRRGDAAGVVRGFEDGGLVREAHGATYERGPELLKFYDDLFRRTGGGVEVLKGAAADDGRTCALEYTLVRMRGRDVPPQAGLAVYERGDSGLLRALRVYDDVDIS